MRKREPELSKKEQEAVDLFETHGFNTGKFEDRFDSAGVVLAAAVRRLCKELSFYNRLKPTKRYKP